MPSIHRSKLGYESADKGSFPPTEPAAPEQVNTSNESSQTLTNASDTEQQFDKTSTKVNEAIKELSSIYSQIGYSEEETEEKKSEIFRVINDTVTSFKNSLQREKETIENECEWLRQQIRVMLAMLDDIKGENILRQSHRALVFGDDLPLHDDHREDVYQHMQEESHMILDFDTLVLTTGTTRRVAPKAAGLEARSASFAGQCRGYLTQRLDSFDITQDNTATLQTYELRMDQRLPKPSLLVCKAKLNSIFLEVLKTFVSIFSKFNELNLLLWENLDSISEESQCTSPLVILGSIPDRATAEEHAKLIDEFHFVLGKLDLTRQNSSSESGPDGQGRSEGDHVFIISSPRKQKMQSSECAPDVLGVDRDEWMNKLRETNYKIVRIIRNLKITKLTNDVILALSNEIARTEREVTQRTNDMKRIIKECIATIDLLSLSEKELVSLQRVQDPKDPQSQSGSCDGFFDIETLNFIETNPREFGLLNHHLDFITKLSNTLGAVKEAKQKKWDYYHSACQGLWEKLHENQDFVLQFLASNSNLTDSAIMNFQIELKRLYEKRSEFVDKFISDSRKQIHDLQSRLLFSDDQCRQFKYYAYDVNDDTMEDKEVILSEHELEIDRLTQEYQAKEPILSLYSQLNELREDQNFLDESSKDSSRLLSKNSCRILLNEEKIRKKIARNMPRVITSLKQEIINFNNKQHSGGQRTMSVDGEDLLEKILLIESNCGVFAGKGPRGKAPHSAKKQTGIMRSTSPDKRLFGASRSSSPIKSSHSPLKVTKLKSRPRTQTQSKHSTSISTFRPALNLAESSPSKPFLELNATRRSPIAKQQGTRFTNNSQGSTLLKPLKSSWSFGPESIRNAYHSADNESAGNTLYSTCSKTSPLRSRSTNDSLGNQSAGNTKYLLGPEYLMNSSDDENKENTLANDRNRTLFAFERPRLSSGSFANSTIIGDDYQSWREERIKQINHEV